MVELVNGLAFLHHKFDEFLRRYIVINEQFNSETSVEAVVYFVGRLEQPEKVEETLCEVC